MLREKNYDEKRVPSRLAEHYTYFGWVRARNKLSDAADRRIMGIALSPKDDKTKTEAIRRRKRFGMNAELVALESEYMKYIHDRETHTYRGIGVMWVFFAIFLIVALATAVIAFVPKAPTTIAEYNANTGIKKILFDISDTVNGMLFYGDGYYVKDSEVNKDAGETGTVVSAKGDLTAAYKIGDDGQLISEDLEKLKEKIEVDEDGNIAILKCEKAYYDSENEESAYYRYYIYYDTASAPLGFIVGFLPSVIPPLAVITALCIVLVIIFAIIAAALKSKKNKLKFSPEDRIRTQAKRIITEMKEEDPALMSKAQRHFYSWQKLMVGAINASNIGKNDNCGGDADDFDEDFYF